MSAVSGPALFLDRDGVVNRDVGYAFRPDQIEWMPDIVAAIRLARENGRRVFIVTNQSGVARGLYSEADVNTLHGWMQAELARMGAVIDGWAYCPHHPADGQGAYRRDCDCRKPRPGMIRDLMHKYAIEAKGSFMIGDKAIDVEAATAAGIRGYLFTGDNLLELVRMGLAG